MSENIHYILFTIGGLILITSLIMKKIQRSFLSEPVLIMLIGFGLNLLNFDVYHVEDSHALMNISSRIVIIVALISTALRIKHAFILRNKRNLAIIVFAGMAGMWILSSLLFYVLFSKDVLFSLLLGAMVTPTDPVVASSMVSGKVAKSLIPERVRSSLSFEAGSNDGLAFLMVMLPFLLITHPTGEALKDFFLKVLLWENLAAVLLAGFTGYVFGRLYRHYDQRSDLDKKAVLGFSIALTFFIYGLFEIIKTNSIVSVFAAGVLLNTKISHKESSQEESVQEVLERLLVVPIFFLFGLIAPYQEWLNLGWILALFALLLLLVRRLPVFLLLKPVLKGYKKKDIWLMGWFGPIGIAAIFYAVHIDEKHHFPDLWPIVSFVVFASTVVHGFSRYYISKWYDHTK